MLDIERRPNVDAGVEQFLDILPAFGVTAIRRIGVGEFVDDDELGFARQGGVDVEFLDDPAPIIDLAARQDFEALRSELRFRAVHASPRGRSRHRRHPPSGRAPSPTWRRSCRRRAPRPETRAAFRLSPDPPARAARLDQVGDRSLFCLRHAARPRTPFGRVRSPEPMARSKWKAETRGRPRGSSCSPEDKMEQPMPDAQEHPSNIQVRTAKFSRLLENPRADGRLSFS